jgi:hypothetical protein
MRSKDFNSTLIPKFDFALSNSLNFVTKV